MVDLDRVPDFGTMIAANAAQELFPRNDPSIELRLIVPVGDSVMEFTARSRPLIPSDPDDPTISVVNRDEVRSM
jgi:hypothetical protein